MKPYNVKSNAKRFARGIAAKHPEYLEAVEPVETAEGSREWFPAVGFIGEATDGFRASIFDSYSADAIVHGWTPSTHGVPVEETEGAVEIGGPDDAYDVRSGTFASDDVPSLAMKRRSTFLFGSLPPGTTIESLARSMRGMAETAPPVGAGEVIPAGTPVHLTPETREAVDARADASGLKAMFDEVPPVGDVDAVTLRPYQQAIIDSLSFDATEEDVSRGEFPVTVTKPRSVGKSTDNLMEMAAAIPPLVPRTREEIEAARAERRERVAKEKAEGLRTASGDRVQPEKISKKKIILDLVRRKGGATQAELEGATDWQRHTLRGYIAGTLRKQLRAVGADIECRRGKGDEPTRYLLVAPGVAQVEASA